MNKLILLAALVLSSCALAEPEEPPKPCSTAGYGDFDFWLGKWTAYDAEGKRLGTNHLERVIGSCGLQENWIGGSGQYRGTSYNFYVPGRKVWRQAWVDNQGGSLLLEGTFADGKMQLQGERVTREGNTVVDRITWTPLEDGRVRQHWQVSEDAGNNWTEVFDGYYQRDETI